jgi:bifunctional non-homologous end joining protein LigD
VADEAPAGLGTAERELAPAAPAPARAELMKAVLCREPFSDPGWIYERKLDGIRCLAIRDTPSGAPGGPRLRMLSRNDLDLTARFPEIRDALAAAPRRRMALDGELVAFEGGRTSFARLAARGRRRVATYFYVFDLLWLDGHDLTRLPLRVRKRLLRGALHSADPLRLSPHRNGEGEALFAHACAHGWEGVVAKRADSPYRATRSRDWLKFKCEAGQELVIGGFTAPRGSRTEFGALLVGYHDGEANPAAAGSDLRYAGKVGTGFDAETLRTLGEQLRAREIAEPPFADAGAIREAHVTWVRPELVAQLAFTEWTNAGRLRHPRFLGLREDKAASSVVRES